MLPDEETPRSRARRRKAAKNRRTYERRKRGVHVVRCPRCRAALEYERSPEALEALMNALAQHLREGCSASPQPRLEKRAKAREEVR